MYHQNVSYSRPPQHYNYSPHFTASKPQHYSQQPQYDGYQPYYEGYQNNNFPTMHNSRVQHQGYHYPRSQPPPPSHPPPDNEYSGNNNEYSSNNNNNGNYYGDQSDYQDPSFYTNPYDQNIDVDSQKQLQSSPLKLVNNFSGTKKPQPVTFGKWKPASYNEPIVKNKELDDWVPASIGTRCANPHTDEVGFYETVYEDPVEAYEAWKRQKGIGIKRKGEQGGGTKKKGKGFSAAGKHPIGALKEKIPTCEFTEEARERNDELRFWNLTAAVSFNGYKFIGHGVNMKIAKAEAAIKALTYLDVPGLDQLNDHVGQQYFRKQQLMESVINEENEHHGKEEPWYIKVACGDEDIDPTPVYKPKELPTPETHPVMFLHQWYGPDITVEYAQENPGFRPLIFSCTMSVQGEYFQGQGPSKKEAQKITAALILKKFETYPPPIVNKGRAKSKPKKKKRKTGMTGVGDLPTIPSQMPTVDFVQAPNL